MNLLKSSCFFYENQVANCHGFFWLRLQNMRWMKWFVYKKKKKCCFLQSCRKLFDKQYCRPDARCFVRLQIFTKRLTGLIDSLFGNCEPPWNKLKWSFQEEMGTAFKESFDWHLLHLSMIFWARWLPPAELADFLFAPCTHETENVIESASSSWLSASH